MNADNPARTIALSLISHTNVGKTTLARTLLGRDIGEVRDEAHVTQSAERHTLIESPAGDRLVLWDTPGFGDSERLAKRLEQAGNPIGWFLAEVWDRYRHRAFWSGQHAVRNMLDEADGVLYLVNAAEAPEDAGYLDAELRVLELIGKPVVVLLNQLGPPQRAADEAAEIERWRLRLNSAPGVRAVLALDAFARCWVQEDALLQAVEAALPATHSIALSRLRAAWTARGRATWQAAMHVLSQRLARAALDLEAVPAEGWTGRIREIGAALGLRREGMATPREHAMQRLAERLDADIHATTDQLIRLHGLDGRATDQVLMRLAEHFAAREPVNEGKAAVIGGMVTGALAGLKADVLTGGLTMGGGLLAGGLIGALGALGMARGFNIVRGVEQPTLAWTDAVLDELFRSALLSYLAVAHFGRGRGQWAASEHPAFWTEAVSAEGQRRHDTLQAIWAARAASGQATDATEGDALRLVDAIEPVMQAASAALLAHLYPSSTPLSAV